MSKAFDNVSRSRLYASLARLNVDPQLISFLIAMYSNSEFVFTHRQHTRVFRTRKGIRQGCKAAPMLWACYLGDILESAE